MRFALPLTLHILDALAATLPAAWLYTLAGWAGTLALPIAERRRQTVRRNIQRLHPDWTPRQLDRATTSVFQETARYYVDAALLPRRTPARVARRLTIDGRQHLDAALASGKGIILASLHLSNPEVAVQALAAEGVHVTALVEHLDDPVRRRWLQHARQSGGHRFVPDTFAGVREAIRTLRDGGVVALLVDRDLQGHGDCVPFARRLARFPLGAPDLALRTDAVLLPVSCVREHQDRFRAVFLPPVAPVTTGAGRTLNVRATLANLITAFEPVIREHVDQWRVFESPWAGCRDTGHPAPGRATPRRRASAPRA